MKKRGSRLIMGTAIGAAAIAVAIDHTRHRLPEPQAKQGVSEDSAVIITEEGDQAATPCGPGSGDNPCSLGEEANPCGLGQPGSPCSL